MRRLSVSRAVTFSAVFTAASIPSLDVVAFGQGTSVTVDSQSPRSDDVNESKALEEQISQLILSLGSEQYATRRQAQLELERIGVPALDQLQQAILNSDPQIATAAKYMIRSSYIRWTGREDPLNVRKLLEQYGSGDVVHRSERIDKLGALPDRQGLPALLRIARYETSIDLSKRAALAVLSKIRPNADSIVTEEEIKKQKELWVTIFDSIGNAKGTACSWLKEYSVSRRDEVPLDAIFWQSAIDHEFLLLASKSGDSSREIASELTRWVAEQFASQGDRDKALTIAKNILRVSYSNREQAKVSEDLYLWALDRKLPEIVIDHSTKYLAEIESKLNPRKPDAQGNLPGNAPGNAPGNFPGNQPIGMGRVLMPFATKLRYLRAEAFRQLNNTAEAELESHSAFERNGSPDETAIYERYYFGDFLRDRMQYDWAERELQQAWSAAMEQRKFEVNVCYKLSMMLADGEDYAGAETAMRPLIERFDKEPDFARETDNEIPAQVIFLPDDRAVLQSQRMRSQWLFYRAKAKLAKHELESAWDDLREALACDPENVDIIITMLENTVDSEQNSSQTTKLPHNDSPRRTEAKQAFASTVLAFRETLPRLEKDLRLSSPTELATYQSQYSNALNTYAWLLASTNHDLAYALECSELACRLQPNNAAYLDTLARCQFKNDNIQNAILVQEQAVAAEPSMRELRRSLETFKGAMK